MVNLGSDKKHKTWMLWKWRHFGEERREKEKEALKNRIYKEGKSARDKIQLYNAPPVFLCT